MDIYQYDNRKNYEKDTFDLLLVYEEPQDGVDYSCGVDTADGLDKEDEERAVASIDRVAEGADFDVQVAELTTRRMNPAQMVGFVACMAAYYGGATKDWRGVKFAIEQVKGPGDTLRPDQERWLAAFRRMGLEARVARVAYDG